MFNDQRTVNDALPSQALLEGAARGISLLYPLDGDCFRRGGVINGIGWVAAVGQVDFIDLFLDMRFVGRALVGLAAGDIASLAGQAPDRPGVGFVFSLPTARVPGDTTMLELRATTGTGQHLLRVGLNIIPGDDLPAPPAWEALRPAPRYLVAHAERPLIDPSPMQSGDIQEWVWRLEPLDRVEPTALAVPGRAAETAPPIQLMCEEAILSEDGLVAVKGWAVAAAGVSALRIEVDGALAGSLVPAEVRFDVGRAFPDIAGAANAGFRFGQRLSAAYTGEHVITLIARDREGNEARVAHHVIANPSPLGDKAQGGALPVAISDGIRAVLDVPRVRDGRAIAASRGSLTIAGWTFSATDIVAVEVFVDNHPLGKAYYGVRREDVLAAHPGCPTPRPGFAMVIPPEKLRPGIRDVRIVIRDRAGAQQEFAFSAEIVQGAVGAGPWQLRTHVPRAEIALYRDIVARNCDVLACGILLPVDPTRTGSEAALAATLASLRAQVCQDWTAHLLVATKAHATLLPGMLARLGDSTRLRIAVVADSALLADLTSAELVMLLVPGDVLGEDALAALSAESATRRDADFIYSDTLRRDPADGKIKPFFKPGFSPDLLLATNYIGRAWVARHALLADAAIRFGDLVGLGEWDMVLRLSEHARAIAHVPKILCEQAPERAVPRRDRASLVRALHRRGITAEIIAGPVPGTYQLRRAIQAGGHVSIIIPTAGARGLIETTLRLIRTMTDWPEYELICLDNIPTDDAPEHLRLKALLRDTADTVLNITGPFNWSRFNNLAARSAVGDYLLFLNDDIEIQDPTWLRRLVEQAQRPEIGVVGPQLLYPDGRVQHAGMFLTERSARHAFRLLAGDDPGAFGLARTQREVISVTGACMMMRRDVFDRLGGFDEAHPVVNNDLDFNLRANQAGLRVIYTPSVSLIHHEMVTRAALPDAYDVAGFTLAWNSRFAAGDPFHNPNLSREVDDYVPVSEPVLIEAAGRPLATRGEIRRILVLKLDHLGDFVTAFPALRRLRGHFPNAELVVVAATPSLAWAKLEPAIDRMISFDFFHARSSKGQRALGRAKLDALGETLAAEAFDLAIDLRRQSETRPILRRSGARWLAGFDRGNSFDWLDIAVEFEGDVARQRKRGHASDAMVRLIDAVAGQFCDDAPLARPKSARAEGRRALRAVLGARHADLFRPGRRLVCVHPGAGAPNKQWPLASFASLIEALAADGLGVLVIGGADEAGLFARLLRTVRNDAPVANLAGLVGLADLPRILSAMDLFVGNDSGPKHLAATLGVPTVGIHSGTVDAGEWAPIGPTALTVRRDTVCSPCYLADMRDCHRGLACLTGIAVGDVYRACRKLLATVGSRVR